MVDEKKWEVVVTNPWTYFQLVSNVNGQDTILIMSDLTSFDRIPTRTGQTKLVELAIVDLNTCVIHSLYSAGEIYLNADDVRQYARTSLGIEWIEPRIWPINETDLIQLSNDIRSRLDKC